MQCRLWYFLSAYIQDDYSHKLTNLWNQESSLLSESTWFSPWWCQSCWGKGWQRSAGTRSRWWWFWTTPCSPPYDSEIKKEAFFHRIKVAPKKSFNTATWSTDEIEVSPRCRTRPGPDRTRWAQPGKWWMWHSQSSGSTSSALTFDPPHPPSWRNNSQHQS